MEILIAYLKTKIYLYDDYLLACTGKQRDSYLTTFILFVTLNICEGLTCLYKYMKVPYGNFEVHF